MTVGNALTSYLALDKEKISAEVIASNADALLPR